MSPYNLIREQVGKTVPFARHAGVKIIRVGDGEGEAQLEQTETSINHIGSQHAGALFTLGEAASGAAMAGAFVSVLMSIRPVASDAQITYKKVAKGTISALGKLSRPGSDLLSKLEQKGRVVFEVTVELKDTADDLVAAMSVEWHVKRIQS